MIAFSVFLLVGLAAHGGPGQDPPIVIPPKAASVAGVAEQITLGPVFKAPYACVEHPLGQLPWAGDALGTDCMVLGGQTGEGGFQRLFATDGKTNADWYGWRADVLAPVDGEVVGVFEKPETNSPGSPSAPPAGMIQIRDDAGIIVVLAHVREIAVARGIRVSAGQAIAKVGNNGFARAPHIHIGAWRQKDAVPVQIRWDLRKMAEAQEE